MHLKAGTFGPATIRRRVDSAVKCALESIEARLFMDATPVGRPTLSYAAETTTAYGANSYMAVEAAAHGTGSYGFQSWGYLEFGNSSAVYGNTTVPSDINGLDLQLYNTATSGNYHPYAGSFSVYVIPNDSVASSDVRFKSGTGVTSLGTSGGDATALGITSPASNWLVGTWNITSGLQMGYSTFTGSTTGSTASGAGTSGSSAVMGSSARQAIANDLTSKTPLRFAVVANDTSFAADWEGNFSSNYPQLKIDYQPSAATAETFTVSQPTITVDKTAGTAHVEFTRTSTGDLSDTATVSYAISNGAKGGQTGEPYNATPATRNVDYSGNISGTITFAAGSATASIDVPITNNSSIYGDRSFTVSISNPTVGGANRVAATGSSTNEVVTIHDARTTNVFQNSSDNATVQPAGVRSGSSGKTYFNVESSSNGANASYGVLDYNHGNGVDLPFMLDNQVGTINSISISTVTGFPVSAFNRSGLFNVYLVDDSSTDIQPGTSPLTYNSSLDANEGLGNQLGTKHLLGQINYDISQPIDVFTSYALTNADAATLNLLKTDLNTGSKFRVVVTPGDSGAAASWEGQYSFQGQFESPILSFNYTPASALPSWLASGSQATYDAASKTLSVSGPTTIVADPGADAPVINASGVAAVVTVAPTGSDRILHLGGVNLTGGASLLASVLGSRSHANHLALVLGTAGGAAPTFSVDSSSKLDLGSNDLIVHNGSLSAVQALADTGRNAPAGVDGNWNGKGLTSSVAASADSSAGYEQTLLAVARNGDLFAGSYGSWSLGSQSETLSSSDILVKYTYNGDFTLDGKVDGDDDAVKGVFYSPSTTGQSFATGDTNRDGRVDDTDDGAFGGLFYGNGDTFGALL